MTERSEEWWGLRPPEGVTRAWAARAILNLGDRKQPLAFLHDRQSRMGKPVPKKVLKHALAEMAKELRDRDCELDPREDCEFQLYLRYLNWVFRYNARASGSYLYMVLYEKAGDE
mgnify:CR=1 FL=1